jgi:predicted nucleic acid-binding protein
MTFVDSGYLIALVDRNDSLHQKARRWAAFLHDDLVTTSAVWLEVFNHCTGQPLRDAVHRFFDRVTAKHEFETLIVDQPLFDRGLHLHRARPDKYWSLTDCISFTVMTDRQITRALAYDHHFEQAGFEALLRRDPP